MPETAQQYIDRILGCLGTRDPREVLRTTPNRLDTLTRSRTDDDLRWTASPSRWSSAAIVAHLADAEVVASYRVRMILASPGVTIQAFDQNTWAATFDYEHQDVAGGVALFGQMRQAWLRLVEHCGEECLDRYGVHAERGKETIRHLLRLYAGHDLNHLAQIERLLEERDRSRPSP
jgi:hypothetical protein